MMFLHGKRWYQVDQNRSCSPRLAQELQSSEHHPDAGKTAPWSCYPPMQKSCCEDEDAGKFDGCGLDLPAWTPFSVGFLCAPPFSNFYLIAKPFTDCMCLGSQVPKLEKTIQKDPENMIYLVGGFWPPLWKIWVRQLGWLLIPNKNGKIKFMATKPPTSRKYDIWLYHVVPSSLLAWRCPVIRSMPVFLSRNTIFFQGAAAVFQ